MENKQHYLARLALAIEHLHKCGAYYLRTQIVHETFGGKTVWLGEVEVFSLTGHPKAKHCFAWFYGEPEEFIAILELPPVDSAQAAVKVGVAYQIKKAGV